MRKMVDWFSLSLIVAVFALAGGYHLAFGQSAPSASGFGGNPWQQIGQHLAAGGNPPVLSGSGCGSFALGSTDTVGTLLNGGATSGCVLTFFQPWNVAPFCMVVDQTTATGSIVVVSRTAITFGTIVGGDIIKWICIGQAGG